MILRLKYRVSVLDRRVLLADYTRPRNEQKFKWSFLTAFSVQHRKIKDIVNKHWKVLKKDRCLGPVLPDRAAVTYRGATSMQGSVSLNVVDPPKRTSFYQLKGFYSFRRCNVCHHNTCGRRKTEVFTSTTTGRSYPMKQFTTCAMHHIVYLLTCPCKKQYVGNTIRPFSVRANEHITNIKNGKTNHNVPKHYIRQHNKDP